MALLTSIYLAIAPIYWLPGLSPSILSLAKMAMFALLAGFTVVSNRYWKYTSSEMIVCLAIASIFAFLSISFTSPLGSAVAVTRNIIEPLIWTLIIFSIPALGWRGPTTALVRNALFIFLALSFYPLLASIGLVPDVPVPRSLVAVRAEAGEGRDYLYEALRASTAGFNGARTGWGMGLALTLLALACIVRASNGARARLMSYVIFACALVDTLVVEARGGTLGTLAAGAFMCLSDRNERRLIIPLTICLLIGLLAFDVSSLLPERFFADLSGTTRDWFSIIDAVSTGRLSTYVAAFELFGTSPLVGVGPSNAIIELRGGLENVAIHNVWLRALAEGGLLLIVPMLVVTVLIVRCIGFRPRPVPAPARGPAKRHGTAAGRPPAPPRRSGSLPMLQPVDWRPVIVCGLVFGMIEPGAVFGSFNNNLAFWTAVAATLRQRFALHALRPRPNFIPTRPIQPAHTNPRNHAQSLSYPRPTPSSVARRPSVDPHRPSMHDQPRFPDRP